MQAMSEEAASQLAGGPILIRSVPEDRVHRPKLKPWSIPFENSLNLAPPSAFCRLSGGIQRLGGSAFSAFKPLVMRTSPEETRPTIGSALSPNRLSAYSHSFGGTAALTASSPQSSEGVETGGESSASLLLGRLSPSSSLLQVSPRQYSAPNLFCEPSGGSATSIVGRSCSEDWLKTNTRSRYQEKNRKAQARFRERRKTEAVLKTERLGELEAELLQLTKACSDLTVKTETLEQCLLQQASSRKECSPPSLSLLHHQISASHCNSATSCAPAGAVHQPQTWEEFTAWYHGLVQKLEPLLEPAQNGDHSAIAHITVLWREGVGVIMSCFSRPDGSLRIRAQTEPAVTECYPKTPLVRPDTADYARVSVALKLTVEQIRQASKLHKEVTESMRALLQQRQALHAIIDASTSNSYDANCVASKQHVKCLEVFPQLEATLEEERRISGLLTHEFFQRIVTPVQGAILCVGLWPYLPDSLAILTAVTKSAATEPLVLTTTFPDIASQLPAALDRATLTG